MPDIFHIGYQRTGSTWLQKGLFPLLSSHVFSVKSAQWKIFHATSINDLSNCYPELNDQDTRNKIIIDSEEGISGGRYTDYLQMPRKISWINRNAKILIVLRSQFTMLPSLYYLYVKKGGSTSANDYCNMVIENNKLNYLDMYNSYLDYFPKENIKILFFEDLVASPTLYAEDLLSWMECPIPETIPGERFKNPKTTALQTSLCRRINSWMNIDKFHRNSQKQKNSELTNALARRSRVLKIINTGFELSGRLGVEFSAITLNRNIQMLIETKYGASNQRLFSKLKTDHYVGYPGSGVEASYL